MSTSNVFAGSDTTAAEMRAVVYYLMKHPDYEKRLLLELQDAYESGKLSRIAQRDEVEQLPFYNACMQEAMRMRKSINHLVRRHILPGHVTNLYEQILSRA